MVRTGTGVPSGTRRLVLIRLLSKAQYLGRTPNELLKAWYLAEVSGQKATSKSEDAVIWSDV